MTDEGLRVLIVEDDEPIAELYRTWTYDDWSATVAGTVDAAMEHLEGDEPVDLVVLDRRLPDGRGGEVLEALRAAGNECPVIMLTAVEPDFDIIEMPFDEYMVKPVTRETFRDRLSRLADRLTYDEQLREYYALASKKAVLEARKARTELQDSDEYQQLCDRIETQRERVDSLREGFSARGYKGLFKGMFDEPPAGN